MCSVWYSCTTPRYCFLHETEIQILSFPPEEVQGFADMTQQPLTLSLQTFCLDLSDAKVSQPPSRCETVEERKSPCICRHWAKVQQTTQRFRGRWPAKSDTNEMVITHLRMRFLHITLSESTCRLYWGEWRVSLSHESYKTRIRSTYHTFTDRLGEGKNNSRAASLHSVRYERCSGECFVFATGLFTAHFPASKFAKRDDLIRGLILRKPENLRLSLIVPQVC